MLLIFMIESFTFWQLDLGNCGVGFGLRYPCEKKVVGIGISEYTQT